MNTLEPRRSALASILVLGLAFAAYWGTALVVGHTGSPRVTHYDQLARSFLGGRLDLVDPRVTLDLTPHGGRWYLPFSPLPALLLLPWVAVAGVQGTSTVLFSCLMGAVSVASVDRLLVALRARGWLSISEADTRWLTLLFALGTVQWYVTVTGSVWFLAQTCAVTFAALAASLAVERDGGWAPGTALAAAVLARPTLVLLWPFIAAVARQKESGDADPPARWRRWCFASLIPVAIAFGLLLGYNWARFGDALDFGYMAQAVNPRLAHDLKTYGQFHPHFLLHNLQVMLIGIPQRDDASGALVPVSEGMGLLLTSPAVLYLARAAVRARGRLWALGAWAAVLLALVPLALYYNSGWQQFGYRFALDFMVPAMALVGLGLEPKAGWTFRVLVLLGVAVNAWGVAWWFGGIGKP